MKDEEIATKRLSDWKPETDPKLQKAFGKFIEEAGELLEATYDGCFSDDLDLVDEVIKALEDELADCDASIDVICQVCGFDLNLDPLVIDKDAAPPETIEYVGLLNKQLGAALKAVGRCQIQGVDRSDPNTGVANRVTLQTALSFLCKTIHYVIEVGELDNERIEVRKQAKIASKLPWIMGTATDLLPDPPECEPDQHDWEYLGTDRGGSHKGEDAYKCRKCPKRKYEM